MMLQNAANEPILEYKHTLYSMYLQPGLNPPEHLWGRGVTEIRISDVQPTNLQQLLVRQHAQKPLRDVSS